MPYSLGNVTQNTIKVGPEAHKLFLEFEVGKDDGEKVQIHIGQPVKLAPEGNAVLPADANEPEANIIGISTQEGYSAYGDFVAVATRGYVVLLCEMDDDVEAVPGPVKYAGYDEAGSYANTVIPANTQTHGGRIQVAPADLAITAGPLAITPAIYPNQFGWVLDAAPAGAGAVVRVLVKN